MDEERENFRRETERAHPIVDESVDADQPRTETQRERDEAVERRHTEEATENDFTDAHLEGLHDDVPREFCPECEARGWVTRHAN